MGFPEWFVIAWLGLGWACTAILNGEQRKIKYNAGGTLAKLLLLGIMLYWGGFFA